MHGILLLKVLPFTRDAPPLQGGGVKVPLLSTSSCFKILYREQTSQTNLETNICYFKGNQPLT